MAPYAWMSSGAFASSWFELEDRLSTRLTLTIAGRFTSLL